MKVGILGFRVGFQIGSFGGPVGILPYYESFVQGVEAMTAQVKGGDRKRFLIAFGVCEIQGQGVSDPTLFFEGLDHFLNQVVGHCFILVGKNEVHISTGRSISNVASEISNWVTRRLQGSMCSHNFPCPSDIKSWKVCLPFGLAAPVASDNDGNDVLVCDQAGMIGDGCCN